MPFFPEHTKMITPTLGVQKKDGEVYYLHSGIPIASHQEEDLIKFRYITSNLIRQGLCKNKDIVDCFHVSGDSVRRWKKKLMEEGETAFFKEENRQGHCYKLMPEVLTRIQEKLDEGSSVNSIAKAEGLSEGSLRYAISKGRLKKKNHHKE